LCLELSGTFGEREKQERETGATKEALSDEEKTEDEAKTEEEAR
jgi:hypothetical protein